MEKLTLLDARTFILDKRRCGISASTCNFYNSSIAFLCKYVLHIPWNQDLVPRMKRNTRLPQLLSMKLCRKLLNCRQYISKLRGQYYFPYTPPQIRIHATLSHFLSKFPVHLLLSDSYFLSNEAFHQILPVQKVHQRSHRNTLQHLMS